MTILTHDLLKTEAVNFSHSEIFKYNAYLYGITDGKTIGTYLERKFFEHLDKYNYIYQKGKATFDIDLPKLNVDIKITHYRHPQSSCPYRSIEQRIFGLGYSIILFVYDKENDSETLTASIEFKDVVFIDEKDTADYTTSKTIKEVLDSDIDTHIKEYELGWYIDNMMDTLNLAVYDENVNSIIQKISDAHTSPDGYRIGKLTISPAFQWRLNYGRALAK